ncbi:unknown [Clostridium sp. CAG:1013]|nr:unknown [Clostridium sp. CAG:1013]
MFFLKQLIVVQPNRIGVDIDVIAVTADLIGENSLIQEILQHQAIIAHHPAAFPNAQLGSGTNQFSIFKTAEILAVIPAVLLHPLSRLYHSLGQTFGIRTVHAEHMTHIGAAHAFGDGPHSRQMQVVLGEHMILKGLLQHTAVGMNHVFPLDSSPKSAQGASHHLAVFSALFKLRTGISAQIGVSCAVDVYFRLYRVTFAFTSAYHILDFPVLHDYIRHLSLKNVFRAALIHHLVITQFQRLHRDIRRAIGLGRFRSVFRQIIENPLSNASCQKLLPVPEFHERRHQHGDSSATKRLGGFSQKHLCPRLTGRHSRTDTSRTTSGDKDIRLYFDRKLFLVLDHFTHKLTPLF